MKEVSVSMGELWVATGEAWWRRKRNGGVRMARQAQAENQTLQRSRTVVATQPLHIRNHGPLASAPSRIASTLGFVLSLAPAPHDQ
jgi:hypothetical protein